MIGLIAVTAGGRATAARLAAAWPGQTLSYDGPARQALPRAWAQCDGLVCFLAVGATVRLIAPLLDSKWTDPAVVCMDESARYAVAVVGGHAAGANALATRVAEVFGADVVITTATDAVSLPGLDMLGWPVEGAIGAVSRALLDGERVRLESQGTWPLPPLPDTVGDVGNCRILITDRAETASARTAVLRPPSLIIGVAAGRGVAADEVLRLADGALAEAGLSPACVAAVVTAEGQTGEPAIQEAAQKRGWPLVTYPASRLRAVAGSGRRGVAAGTTDTATTARGATGAGTTARGTTGSGPGTTAGATRAGATRGAGPTAGVTTNGGTLAAGTTIGVAEAAALAIASELVLPERRSRSASVAVARVWPRGRLALVGTGPGARDLLTTRAIRELRRSSVVAGLGQSLDQVGDLLRTGTRVLASKPGEQEVCAQEAVREARRGHAVAVVLPAEAAAHILASRLLDLAGDDIDVVQVPGLSADLAGAAVLGSPLGDCNAVIRPGEHTPWEAISRKVRAVAEADFVITFCPSPGESQTSQLGDLLTIVREYRPADTPVAVVQDPQGAGQEARLDTLGRVNPQAVGKQCIVIVGTSRSRVIAGRMVTPADV